MKKIYFISLAVVLAFTLNCLADNLEVKTNNTTNAANATTNANYNNTNSFLSSSGKGGMCRGGLHIVSAPLLIPISLAYGFALPFDHYPKNTKDQHNYLRITKISFEMPLTIAVNGGVGAGGCALEIICGLFDVMSLGNYDLPKYAQTGSYDTRPYFMRLKVN
ncbi:hypothetical protein KAH27_08875 [bacterium]|nr:hypothetical protein [bacterium]